MFMHFTDLALANSCLLYRKDRNEWATPKRDIIQFLQFQMDVAMTFLAQHDNDNSEFSEDDESDVEVQGQKHPVRVVPHISVCRRANAHLPGGPV